jgi:hypothetical protein
MDDRCKTIGPWAARGHKTFQYGLQSNSINDEDK